MNEQFYIINPLAAFFSLLCCIGTAAVFLFLQRPTVDKTARLGCLDGLRGFLALGVFFHHYVISYGFYHTKKWTVPSTAFYTLSGQTGVALFFMITGFLFWHKLWTAKGRVNWYNLYLSRIFRIVPLYWFAVLLIVSIVFISGGFSLKTPIMLLLKRIVGWLLFFFSSDINGFPDTWRIIAGVQWTLKYEWIFYLSLPLLAAAIRLSKRVPSVLWLLAGLVVLGKIVPVSVIPAVGIKSDLFVYFFIGAFAASLYGNARAKFIAQKRIVSYIAVLAVVILFNFFNDGYGKMQILLLALFFMPVALGNSMFGLFKLPATVLLGDLSYSIYLLHGILLYFLFTMVFPTFFSPGTGVFWIYAGMSLTGVVLVSLSWLTFYMIEKPFMDFGKRYRRFKSDHEPGC